MKNDYYLGLDCGTSSVGWAVTDNNYNIQKAKGKSLWGIRLFEEAKPAAERREYRATRRRTYRKRARLDLINELFEVEINKIDPKFFQRLKDSKYLLEDKTNKNDKNTLFNDKDFNDIKFHLTYPTIYHLRSELIHSNNPHDIRLVYLAIHHIIKNRGHFIYDGQNIESVQNVERLLNNLKEIFFDLFPNIIITYPNGINKVKTILTDKTVKNKLKELKSNIIVEAEDTKLAKTIQGEIAKALNGNKVNITKLIPDITIEEEELPNKDFTFSSSTYDINEVIIKNSLGLDNFEIISCLKEIYDWSLLYEILQGQKYISDAKINNYEIHKKELNQLKELIKKYNPTKFEEAFKTTKEKLINYCSYIGHGLDNGKKDKGPIKSKCSKEEINKYFLKLLEKAYKENKDDKILIEIYKKLELGQLLPKIVSTNNRVIPYQVNLLELKAILEKASNYLNFLNIKDSEGYSVKEKIIAIMEFRIPYFVGPLVEKTDKNKEYQKFSWLIRKNNSTGRILPWKFANQVDLAACGNEFIKRMSRKCSYLPNENCLPKNSLLYSEYSLLNELNNFKINGQKPPIELRDEIFSLFKNTKTVSTTKIRNLLIARGIYNKQSELVFSGIDKTFKSSLKSYIDFKEYLENEKLTKDEVELIIEWGTIFNEGQNLIKNKIIEQFGTKLTEKEIKDILGKCKTYTGWGRLSKKFLTEMYHFDEYGECKNIITLMKETSNNLMELMSNKYTISKSVEEELSSYNKDYNTWSYENLVEPLLVSPSIKRSIWQTLQIVKEIREVTQKDPKRIFIEMARGPEEAQKNKRTISRKETLIKQYQELTNNDEVNKILKSLEDQSDANLRKDKLYLYFTQMGRCMYSNEIINLEDLLNSNNKYDIDHIYPQKSIKDDSLNNRVLVLKEENGRKSDKYPLSLDIQTKCSSHWALLYKKHFITKEKYNRLIRKTELDKDELESFIARQIVETRQSTKATGELLKKLCPNSTIVYSKANTVADFKTKNQIYKSRGVNDLHHAKDAYLNIVVGNAYFTKFTKDPSYILKNEIKDSYNLSKLFFFDIRRNNYLAWERDINGKARRDKENQIDGKLDYEKYPETGTIVKIRATLSKNNILFTRQTFQRSGGISDMLFVKKNDNTDALLPIKSSDKNLLKVEKYGGLNNIAKAYFFLTEYTNKNKRVKRIFDVPIYKISEFESGKTTLYDYCINDLNLNDPNIIIPQILVNTKIKYKNFIYEISGAMGDQLGLKTAVPLVISEENYKYYFYIEKYLEKMKEFLRFHRNESEEIISNFSEYLISKNKITKEKNINLYSELKEKVNKTIFQYRISDDIRNNINNNIDLFINSSIYEQTLFLEQFMTLFSCKYGNVNFTLIEGSKKTGTSTMSRNLNSDIEFIYQSVTGLYENKKKVKI
ncbi:MAG: type II CRISPR RNA-guided endonuclease Cas9 [Pleomorphochaeta sp.]